MMAKIVYFVETENFPWYCKNMLKITRKFPSTLVSNFLSPCTQMARKIFKLHNIKSIFLPLVYKIFLSTSSKYINVIFIFNSSALFFYLKIVLIWSIVICCDSFFSELRWSWKLTETILKTVDILFYLLDLNTFGRFGCYADQFLTRTNIKDSHSPFYSFALQ